MWSMVEAEIQTKMKRVELLDWHERDPQAAVAAEEEEVFTNIGRAWEAVDQQRGRRECSAAEGLREFKDRPV